MTVFAEKILGYMILWGLLFLFMIVPIILTVVNLYYIFAKPGRFKNVSETLTWILGPLFSAILYDYLGIGGEWQEQLFASSAVIHTPVSGRYVVTILVLVSLGLLGYFLLKLASKRLPPLVKILSISFLYIGCGVCVMWIIQVLGRADELSVYLAVFPLNVILLSASVVKSLIMEQKAEDEGKDFEKFTGVRRLVEKSCYWPALAFLMMWPVLGICIAVLALFGQEPSAAVKAFTETSDWMLSQRISPPTVYGDGHYLCTVAAGGHEKLVKPQRMGVRHGHWIVVNRQLCVANAFEQVIEERTPRFHRFVRHVYDTYGYPVTKHIRTPLAADVTYLVMKPLEWIFLLVLYLTDCKPEDRIARQYLPVRDSVEDCQ